MTKRHLSVLAGLLLCTCCCGCIPLHVATDEEGHRLLYEPPSTLSVRSPSGRTLGERDVLDCLDGTKSSQGGVLPDP